MNKQSQSQHLADDKTKGNKQPSSDLLSHLHCGFQPKKHFQNQSRRFWTPLALRLIWPTWNVTAGVEKRGQRTNSEVNLGINHTHSASVAAGRGPCLSPTQPSVHHRLGVLVLVLVLALVLVSYQDVTRRSLQNSNCSIKVSLWTFGVMLTDEMAFRISTDENLTLTHVSSFSVTQQPRRH